MPTLSDLRVRYDEDYYERGVECGISGYSNYRWLPELTIPMAMTIIDTLSISPRQSILDFGCAKGYVVKALRMLRRDATGVDISPYAIEQSDPGVAGHVHLIESLDTWRDTRTFDFALAKDVLEHVPHEAIHEVVGGLASRARCVMAVVPLGDGERYIIDAYERDVTHVIREPAQWWADRFGEHFGHVDWTYHIEGIKDNWKRVHPKGNAVIIAGPSPAACAGQAA